MATIYWYLTLDIIKSISIKKRLQTVEKKKNDVRILVIDGTVCVFKNIHDSKRSDEHQK